MNVGTVVFGRYRLHEQVGAGGAGVVWRATDELLHQTVALKRVTVTGLDDGQTQLTRDRALREARLAAQLRGHPHVVAVYDVLVDDGDIWLVMEYLPARSLGEILAAQGPLDRGEVARIGAHIADALAAAHHRGIEHRDIKPGNVLIGNDGTVKLTDFGISHLTGDPHLTQTGISGTPAYLAPEVAGKGESTPASDIFSLGSTLYAAVEGQPPFGTDDNLLRLLNVVRTGIIRPPTTAGPLEPLLLRLLQVSPSTRPDAATTRDLLTDLATRLTGTREHVHSQPPRLQRWWPPPRRAALAAGALLTLTAITATAIIGLSTPPGNTGDSQSPSVPGLRTDAIDLVTQKLREADPCRLVDLASLRQFGTPKQVPGPYLNTCEVDIDTGRGEAELRVSFGKPIAVSDLGGTPQKIGDVTIVRQGLESGVCQHQLVLAAPDQPRMFIDTLTYDGYPGDLCAVAEAATTAAIAALTRDGGITYIPNRTAEYSHAGADACALLDHTTLSKIPGLDLNDPSPDYANWSCTWEEKPEGNSVDLTLRLEDSGTIDYYESRRQHKTIAGKKALINRDPQNCDVVVEHRSTPAGIEILEVDLKDPLLPAEERCALATDLATAAEEKLSANPRDAGPCPLINLDSLRQFGQPRFTTSPWLHGCQATIKTTDGSDTRLRVILSRPTESVAALGGTPEQVGGLTIVRKGRIRYENASACRNLLVWADQPRISLTTFTYSDEKVDLCAVAEAATSAAVAQLKRAGGITYTPDRTSGYSHARSDACTLLDTAVLSRFPGLNSNDRSPEFANWSCFWGTKDDLRRVALHLRLDEPVRGDYNGTPTTIAGKTAFLSSDAGSCTIHVVHRSTPTATEMFQLEVEGTLPADGLCTLATELATTVEEKLPET